MEGSATPLVAAITDRLVAAIATGDYLPGSRLPAERELAVVLGVGRTSVRASLAALHDRGLITTTRGRTGGSFVRTQWSPGTAASVLRVLGAHWDEIVDRLEALRRLECAVARAAADRRDEEDLDRIAACLERFRSATGAREAQHADAALHVAIACAARNDLLKAMLLDLKLELSVGAGVHPWGEDDGRGAGRVRALADHEAIVAAIRDGRAEDAERLALEHGRIDRELLEAARERAELATV